MSNAFILISIIVLLFSVILHEMAHGYSAVALGDPTPRLQKRLTLNPLRHLDWFGSVILPLLLVVTQAGFVVGWAKPVQFNPYNFRNRKWGPALVALAGPAVNILLAIIFGLLIRFSYLIGLESPAFLLVASSVVFINLVLALFNLIPIPPLDGHHILFAFLPPRFSYIKNFLINYSFFFIIIVILVIWPYVLPLVNSIFSLLVGNSLFML